MDLEILSDRGNFPPFTPLLQGKKLLVQRRSKKAPFDDTRHGGGTGSYFSYLLKVKLFSVGLRRALLLTFGYKKPLERIHLIASNS